MNDERPYTLRDRCDDAVLRLRQYVEEGGAHGEDHIYELADSYTPIYTADLLQYALDDLTLACVEPEIGTGENTAQSILTAVIYETILDRLWDALREIQDEEEE